MKKHSLVILMGVQGCTLRNEIDTEFIPVDWVNLIKRILLIDLNQIYQIKWE